MDNKGIEQVAHLARIKLDQEAVPEYAKNMTNILKLVDEMSKVNTDDVQPLAHPLEITQRLRADEVTETNQRDTYQESAPAVEQGLYLVPKVIEQES